ncbi:hypothetical protein MCOR17_009177 [Pyricularia oryzae]|nr:hypothetical protein MCOR17_009177 [Pyricularia oryzae]
MRFSTIAMALSALFAVGFAAPSPPSGDPSSPGCVGGFCGNNLTQGIELSPVQYIIIALLATLASIGTTPIPSSSLVLTVMIANSVDVPVTGMYAVIVAIDWFVDRFRTAVNVSSDIYAAKILTKITGITDDGLDKPENTSDEELAREHYAPAPVVDNTHRV